MWLSLFVFYASILSFCVATANDVILGGIFSEHFSNYSVVALRDRDESPCGAYNAGGIVDRVAMDFAVMEINNSDAILPGISIGVNTKDSCNNLDHAIQNTLDYPFVKRRFINQTLECNSSKPKKCCFDLGTTADARLMAIIAGGHSHIVKAIVNLVGVFNVPVVGYSSTSPSLNKIDYFLRTVPTDAVTAEVIVDLIQKFNWNIVLLLYADTEFGHYAADSFRLAIRRRGAKICVAFDDKFTKASGPQAIKRVVKGMEGAKKSHVVVYFGTVEDFVYFEEQSKDTLDLNDYMWISSEIWLGKDLVGMGRKVTNMLSIIPKQSFPSHRFYDYLRNREDIHLPCLSTRQGTDNFQRTGLDHMMATDGEGNNCSLAHSMYVPCVLDAVYAVAMALHNMLECESGKSCKENLGKNYRRSLLEYLRNLNFTNPLTNNTVSFDSDGNPNTVYYTAVKLEAGNNSYKSTPVGRWVCQNNTGTCSGQLIGNTSETINPNLYRSKCGTSCAKGQHKSVKDEFPECCWECVRCAGNKYSNSTGQLSCSECPSDRWPNSNHTACAKINPEFLSMSSASGISIFVWDALGIVLTILVVIVFVKYSSSHIIRASSRQLSLLLLLGISMDFSVLIFLLKEPAPIRCCVIFVLSHVTSGLMSGTLFLKTNRIHRIFRKSSMTARPRCMGNTSQLCIVLMIVAIEISLSVSILFLHPDHRLVETTYVQEGDKKKAFVLCNFFGQSFKRNLLDILLWSFDCGMIFICTYQAYLVRKVPENYNEARYITFTMVTISMNTIVYVITSTGMEGYNLGLVYCLFQSVRTSVALGCMFFPKVYIVLFQPEKNVPHNPIQSRLGTFVEDVTTIKVEPADSLSRGSSSHQSESSADSGSGCQTRAILRSHRKVGVRFEKGSESKESADQGDFNNCDQNGVGACADNTKDSAKKIESTEKSLIESINNETTIIVNETAEPSTTP